MSMPIFPKLLSDPPVRFVPIGTLFWIGRIGVAFFSAHDPLTEDVLFPLPPISHGTWQSSSVFRTIHFSVRLYPDKHRSPFSYMPSSRRGPTFFFNTFTKITPLRNVISVVDTTKRVVFHESNTAIR